MNKLFYLSLLVSVLCGACNNGNAQKKESAETSEKTDTLNAFKLPDIPAMYTTPEQQGEFVITHYWDNFNFADTAYAHSPEITEQAFADFAYIANQLPLNLSKKGVSIMMKEAGKEKIIFNYFITLSDKYLYDPNSPFRNEELYIEALETILDSPLLNETEKSRPQYRLDIVRKNRLGEKAIDFTYTLKSGGKGTLYKLASNYTLLFFNNPGCHACDEIIEGMKHSQIINHMLANKSLTILAVYPDEELDEWKKHQKDFPDTWINSYDKQHVINSKSLYDLKAIPTLYLLDKKKTVLLKDATLPVIEEYLTKESNKQMR